MCIDTTVDSSPRLPNIPAAAAHPIRMIIHMMMKTTYFFIFRRSVLMLSFSMSLYINMVKTLSSEPKGMKKICFALGSHMLIDPSSMLQQLKNYNLITLLSSGRLCCRSIYVKIVLGHSVTKGEYHK